MTLRILFSAPDEDWADYHQALPEALAAARIDAELTRDAGDRPESFDYIVYAPDGPVENFAPYVGVKAVLSLWAGVDAIIGNATLTQPLARMNDEGLSRGMVEWVVGHCLRHHLGMDAHIHGQDGVWRGRIVPPIARKRRITLLGLGALGAGCATALSGLGFPVTGWSRTQKQIDGITCLSGDDGLEEALRMADILVLLLPLTDDTTNLMNAARFAHLPEGAFLLNPGRGPLIDDAALLAALDAGRIAHATLDVFRGEPLPASHPFWAHERVTVTPHIAAATRPGSASEAIARNIARVEAGEDPQPLVDRTLGY